LNPDIEHRKQDVSKRYISNVDTVLDMTAETASVRPHERLIGVTIRVVFGSIGRFLMTLGVLLSLVGYTLTSGIVAGHFGIYGASVFTLGALIRLVWLIRAGT
jgi:hypothetical protein